MLSPYGMEIVESCLTCKLRADRIFVICLLARCRLSKRSSARLRIPKGLCCS